MQGDIEAANGFNQLNQSPNVVSCAYTSATKSEERKKEVDRGALSGHFKHSGVKQTHTDSSPITPAGATFTFRC